MRVLYFDCFSGASGDMILGALIDAGVSVDVLRRRLAGLPVAQFELRAERVSRKGLAATQVTVEVPDESEHRHLPQILEMIERADAGAFVTASAGQIFQRLAKAEAGVHGTSIEHVHFHEVGALDAIIDIVGACIGLELLGIRRVLCSPIPVGSGTVTCAHGILPVPAPATARLLQGVPLAACPENGELTTPTGAAILTTLAEGFGTAPAMRLERCGYGAGRREGRDRANLLRVMIGDDDAGGGREDIVVLEASIDDQSPEITAHAVDCLMSGGALDVYTQPIHMKKGRAGVLLTVLCRPQAADGLEDVVFAQTTTFGVRRQQLQRTVLERRFDDIRLDGGTVRIKIGLRAGDIVAATPEFEDCRRVAEATGRPLKHVMADALATWRGGTRHA